MLPSVTTLPSSCCHDGSTPVIIGGKAIHLASSRHITSAVLEAVDYVLPLNNLLPSISFGTSVIVKLCGLPDYGGVPEIWPAFVEDIAEKLSFGEAIAAWCTGSHGRTGTLGASLIAVMEPEIADPIAAIRERHCEQAVETLAQATAVFALKGEDLPAKYKEEFTPITLDFDLSDMQWPPDVSLETKQGAWWKRETHDEECLCSPCMAKATFSPEHKPQGICQCRLCVLNYKLALLGECLEFEGHSDFCKCELCWYVLPSHAAQCLCPGCIWYNTEAEVLKEEYRAIIDKIII